jgi:hypothetical protein
VTWCWIPNEAMRRIDTIIVPREARLNARAAVVGKHARLKDFM